MNKFAIFLAIALIALMMPMVLASTGNKTNSVPVATTGTNYGNMFATLNGIPTALSATTLLNGSAVNISANMTFTATLGGAENLNCTFYRQTGTTFTYLKSDIITGAAGTLIACSALVDISAFGDGAQSINMTIFNGTINGAYLNDSSIANITFDSNAPVITLNKGMNRINEKGSFSFVCKVNDTVTPNTQIRTQYNLTDNAGTATQFASDLGDINAYITSGYNTKTGTNYLTCNATDWVGNMSSSTISYIVDPTGSVTVTEDQQGATLAGTQGTTISHMSQQSKLLLLVALGLVAWLLLKKK